MAAKTVDMEQNYVTVSLCIGVQAAMSQHSDVFTHGGGQVALRADQRTQSTVKPPETATICQHILTVTAPENGDSLSHAID